MKPLKDRPVDVLKKAIKLIDHKEQVGVCRAIRLVLGRAALIPACWLNSHGCHLPPQCVYYNTGKYIVTYCWSLTPRGDKARIAFLKRCIKKLQK